MRMPANHEVGGETILSVREVLRQRRAHCIEGAFVAACALWVHGEAPLVLHMDCDASDYPHVVAAVPPRRPTGARCPRPTALRCASATRSTAACASSRCRTSTSTRTARRQDAAQLFRRVRPAPHRPAGLGDGGRCVQRGARPARAAAALPAALAGAGEAAHAPRRVRAAGGEGGRASEVARGRVARIHAPNAASPGATPAPPRSAARSGSRRPRAAARSRAPAACGRPPSSASAAARIPPTTRR